MFYALWKYVPANCLLPPSPTGTVGHLLVDLITGCKVQPQIIGTELHLTFDCSVPEKEILLDQQSYHVAS